MKKMLAKFFRWVSHSTMMANIEIYFTLVVVVMLVVAAVIGWMCHVDIISSTVTTGIAIVLVVSNIFSGYIMLEASFRNCFSVRGKVDSGMLATIALLLSGVGLVVFIVCELFVKLASLCTWLFGDILPEWLETQNTKNTENTEN